MLHSRGCPRRAVQTADAWTPSTRPRDRDTALVLVHTSDNKYKICYGIRVLEEAHPEMIDKAEKQDRLIHLGGAPIQTCVNVGVAAVLPHPKRLDPEQRLADADAEGLVPEPDEHTIAFYGDLEEARTHIRSQALGRLRNDDSMDAFDWDGVAEQWHQILDSIEHRKLTRQERVWDTEMELHLAELRVSNLKASLQHLKERANEH